MSLTPRVRGWQGAGRLEEVRGRGIHVFERAGAGPLLLLLHGFPSSSFDWRRLLEVETDHAVLTFDFLGFGLSEKPRDHRYSMFWQADLAEELVARHAGGRRVFIVAHDMGTSVATELMARDIEGRLEMDVAGILLFNGSMVLERARPTLGQKLLRGPLGPLAARLTSKRLFLHQFGSVFSKGHPLSAAEADDQWALLCHNGGRTMGSRVIAYMDERMTYADRWHGAIRDWEGELALAWGMLDPVATTDVLAALRELRPAVPVREMPELGHYPQVEEPETLAAALREAVSRTKS
jgi:pimeloyl-ACP methyl ester carboxylesterase